MRACPGMGQAQIDDTELWILAELIDSFTPKEEPGGMETEAEANRLSEDLIRARLLHAEGKGPAPKAPPSSAPIPAAMMEAFEERRRQKRDAASGGNPR